MSTRRHLLPGHIRTYGDNRRAPIKQQPKGSDQATPGRRRCFFAHGR
jgi:hypothetical protein